MLGKCEMGGDAVHSIMILACISSTVVSILEIELIGVHKVDIHTLERMADRLKLSSYPSALCYYYTY